jgi:hypothetical protein
MNRSGSYTPKMNRKFQKDGGEWPGTLTALWQWVHPQVGRPFRYYPKISRNILRLYRKMKVGVFCPIKKLDSFSLIAYNYSTNRN